MCYTLEMGSRIPVAGTQTKCKGDNDQYGIIYYFLFLCVQLPYAPPAMSLLHDGLYPQPMSRNKSFLLKDCHTYIFTATKRDDQYNHSLIAPYALVT